MRGREYFHPLVHLVNGQRLYYILIRALQDVRKVVKLIQDEISLRPPFEAHSCAYVVFGEVDIIIRACVADTDLKPFLDRLNQLDLEIDNVVLVNNSHTWYQHRIEESRKFKTYFQTRVDANQLLHRQEIPEWLKFEDRRKPRIKASSRKKKTDAEPQGPIKYFVFAHETKGSIDPLYDALRKELYESSSSEQRISLHKITSQKYESGVLIEGETVDKKTRDPEDAVYALTDRIKALGVYRTTTYVRAKGHVDKHDLYLPEQPVSNRKRVNTRNAVLSETKQLLTDEVYLSTHSCARFIEIVALNNLYPHILVTSADWETVVENTRQIFSWIFHNQNGKLVEFLLSEYARLETTLREALMKQVDDYAPEDFSAFGWLIIVGRLRRRLKAWKSSDLARRSESL